MLLAFVIEKADPPLKMRKSWLPRARFWLLIPAGLALAFLGLFVWTQPALAAVACPSCFGFEALAPRLYVDGEMSAGDRAALAGAAAEAEKRVASFYGGLKAAPTILACATEACSGRLGGGGARGVAYATVGLRLSPSGLDPAVIAHERSHIELHARIGLVRWATGAVPAWFDEGLAVVVSGDPRYLLPDQPGGDRCRAEPGTIVPSTHRDWLREASARPELYAEAACRVARWMASQGGRKAVLSLLERIAAGEDFAQASEDPSRR